MMMMMQRLCSTENGPILMIMLLRMVMEQRMRFRMRMPWKRLRMGNEEAVGLER